MSKPEDYGATIELTSVDIQAIMTEWQKKLDHHPHNMHALGQAAGSFVLPIHPANAAQIEMDQLAEIANAAEAWDKHGPRCPFCKNGMLCRRGRRLLRRARGE